MHSVRDPSQTVERTTLPSTEPGAKWLRCDLHVHTPFDPEKRFGADIRAAIRDLQKSDATRLAAIAERSVDACRYPEVKEPVGKIMEGSAEAFRLRSERYGY